MKPRPLITFACRAFLIAIPLLAAAIVSGVVLYWGMGINRLGDNTIVLHALEPVPERRTYGLAAALPAAAFALLALWHLFRMFRLYGKVGDIAYDIIIHLRRFSTYSFLMAVSAFLLSGVMRWAMGVFDNAPLWTHLGLSITHIIIILSAAIIHIATWLIEDGYRYGREVKEYV